MSVDRKSFSVLIEAILHRNIRRFVCQQITCFVESLELFQHRREIMRLVIGFFCCLGASMVVKTVDAAHYNTSYIQAPCDKSGNREITPGANGYQRYGFIGADNDACYNPYPDCRIRLSVSSGYLITLRFQWIAIETPDVLLITGAINDNSIQGYITPPYSFQSTSNWMNLQFLTNADNSNCLRGFRLHYTSFHYGECSENEFRCTRDGRCIPNEVVCDSYDNCGDWSDESSATCGVPSASSVTDVTPPWVVTPPEPMNPVYDHSYIQAPCDNSRELTLGANGFKRYGIIEADDDGCYNPHSDCHIRLSVSSDYYITLRFKWVAITYPDVLTIKEEAQTQTIDGHSTPSYSIYSTSNWMILEFVTSNYYSTCWRGFRLYYTSFHYGECSKNEFRCSLDGRCIPKEVKCDSYDNCGDWSDEWEVTCSGSALTTDAIVMISVTCAVVGAALFIFLFRYINRRKQRHISNSSNNGSSSSSSVDGRRSNPARNALRQPPHQTEPLGFVEPIGPPKYIYAPPAYNNINSIYEDPDQIHPPPYQSTFTTTPYGSNNNESLTCDNDNTPRLNNHEDNSNSNNNSNSNDAVHF